MPASPTPRRDGRSSPPCRWRRTWCCRSDASSAAPARPHALDQAYDAVPPAGRAATPGGRLAVGRRAADAHARPGAGARAEAAHRRRAVARAGADRDQRGLRGAASHPRQRHGVARDRAAGRPRAGAGRSRDRARTRAGRVERHRPTRSTPRPPRSDEARPAGGAGDDRPRDRSRRPCRPPSTAPAARSRVEERPVPRPGPGEVLVEVGHCGICGSDIHIILEGWGKPGVGRGPRVDRRGRRGRRGRRPTWAVGDGVVGGPSPRCGHCQRCLEGKPSQCENRERLDDRGRAQRRRLRRLHRDRRAVAAAPPRRARRPAAALAEPLAVALHGITRGEHRRRATR